VRNQDSRSTGRTVGRAEGKEVGPRDETGGWVAPVFGPLEARGGIEF
jgi:hypothetical protein